ncbi:hypothetical protein DFP72DRAFT_808690 [Ephemerocybe angulata]|uniref:HTH La-type RNA-binding domain-containing protein n=1 Tax=Ephemerocybe angulata TaxID=980116 RepID=A0A8H6M7H4_9AGAR|nr:hypothetical protein DFP72DRAFT_808690 [Tulosesus angulatus]
MGQPNPGAVSYLPPLPPPPPIPPQLLPHPSSNPPSAISPSAAAGSGPPAPPVPVPVTLVPFPLDPTRYYLLGQLEYYLSPQNMAKDFFLRKKMDSRGWIPISIIASFNRVRRLTVDANIVREVLYLSSILQVRDDWVRMGGWEQFVLPDAEESVVPEANGNPMARSQMPPPMGMPLGGREPPVDVAPMYLMHNGVPVGPGAGLLPGFAAEVAAHQGGGVNGVGSGDGDEEEDDVLFVMTSDASR